MSSFLETYDLRNDEMLKKRVAAACTKKADAILIESAGTANHAARLVWAKDCMLDPVQAAFRLMWRVVQNGTIQTKQSPASISAGTIATDADIEFVVNTVVDVVVNP